MSLKFDNTMDMMKHLMNFHEKQFETIEGEAIKAEIIGKELVFTGANPEEGVPKIDMWVEWREISVPVTFREAVASGKKILWSNSLDGPGGEVVALDIVDYLDMISRNYNEVGIRELILSDKFYLTNGEELV